MAHTDIDPGLVLTTLRSSDEPEVRQWLQGFLRAHNHAWVDVMGLGWSGQEIEAQQVAIDLVERHWRALWAAAHHEHQVVAVARLDGRLLGCVWAGAERHGYLGTTVGVLHWVYVAGWGRRHGVGTALIGAVKEWMRPRQIRSLQVSVLAVNDAAIRLYRKAGLRIADVRMMGPVDPD
jgi:ribosomal protein S18 acetylase RimI-like enzyme